MDVPIGAKVNCSDGPCGRSTRVILNPGTRKITHVVVAIGNVISETEYMVDVDHIVESSPDKILLTVSQDELAKLPSFSETQFVPSTVGGYMGIPYLMWPYYPPVAPITIEGKAIPINEMTIHRGAQVNAIDGPVGKVDEFLVDPANARITHLIMREGHLWGKREVTIPVSQIDHFQDETVYVRLTKDDVEKLPSVPVRR